jgi:hypothetical protein
MTARPARIKWLSATVAGIVTHDAEYDVIAWPGVGSASASIEALIIDDSGILRHFPIGSADWEVVRI